MVERGSDARPSNCSHRRRHLDVAESLTVEAHLSLQSVCVCHGVISVCGRVPHHITLCYSLECNLARKTPPSDTGFNT